MKINFKSLKSIIICLCSFILIFIIFIFYLNNQQITVVKHVTDHSDVKIVGDYLVEDDLMKAPYILEGTVEDVSESFEYEGFDFVKINFRIDDVLYSKSDLDDNILILREKDMFVLPKESEKYILYLYDYEGPIATNVKMICGGNLGMKEIMKQDKDKNGGIEINEYKQRIKDTIK